MKKIMFKDRYGLTQAVLEGRKTMTRRVVTMTLHKKDGKEMVPVVPDYMFIADDGLARFCLDGSTYIVPKQNQPHFHVGEEVWIAQSYQSLGYKPDDWIENAEGGMQPAHEFAGYTNKMFVRSLYLAHRIRIVDVRVELLQDISNEGCMREGIMEGEFMNTWDRFYFDEWGDVPNHITFKTPRDAFRSLIDRISGKGTWDRNPWVFVYEFELVQ